MVQLGIALMEKILKIIIYIRKLPTFVQIANVTKIYPAVVSRNPVLLKAYINNLIRKQTKMTMGSTLQQVVKCLSVNVLYFLKAIYLFSTSHRCEMKNNICNKLLLADQQT